jgi:hypothetical protein
VVGSWPEPFVHGFEGKVWPTAIACKARRAICAEVGSRLDDASGRLPRFDRLQIDTQDPPSGAIAVIVGTWNAVRKDATAGLLADEPDRSGVFARFVGSKRPLLELLNQQGQPAGSVGKGGGLIAALRPEDGPPTWVVTGTDAKGVAAAASLLGEPLRNRYALASQPGAGSIGVPVP